LLLCTIALVSLIGRRIAGWRAGLFAAAIYSLFYPHRVLLGYISCSQDLITVALACAALLAQLSNRRWLAGVLLCAGAFSKESVVLLPVVLLAWEYAVAEGVGAAKLRQALRSTLPSWLAVAIWAGITVWGRATFGDATVEKAAFATSNLPLTLAGLVLGARLTALT